MKGWVIPPDKNSAFVANMEKVLDVYKEPYNAEFPVVCMDESPKQLIEEGKPSVAMKPGQDARVDYEYVSIPPAKYTRNTTVAYFNFAVRYYYLD